MCRDSKNASCLKLLSWNIDGLDDRDIRERTEAVCDFILSRRPHVVFLQEVVNLTWRPLIVSRLEHEYNCYCSLNPPQRYFNGILVLKREVTVTGNGLQMLDFRSSMGRHLLKLSIQFSGVDLDVMTSHLESTRDYREERLRQLRIAFEEMTTLQTSNRISIFGGDLNLRDAEMKIVNVPPNVVDVWEACGMQERHKFMWDVSENDNLNWPHRHRPKIRFDRIYLSPGDGALQPLTFELVGKERLPRCKRFPSDHWGLWAEFDLKKT